MKICGYQIKVVPLHPLSRDGSIKFKPHLIIKLKLDLKNGNKDQIAARRS